MSERINSTYEEKMNRIHAAIALEPVDMAPVISGNAAFNAAACGVELADYLNDMELNCTCNIEGFQKSGDIDGVQLRLCTPYVLPGMWLSKIRVPGKELSDNELWQVLEEELITDEDYDRILEVGWDEWQASYMVNVLGNPGEQLKDMFAYGPVAKKRFREAGIPVIKEGNLVSPFEALCGGRSLAVFLVDDLLEEPERTEEVFKVIQKANMAKYQKQFESDAKPCGVWVGGWRGGPSILSPAMFERFSWPYFRELVDLCIQYDVTPILHLDSSWDLGLQKFREFPKGKCIMALDGKTDMKLAKETVGDMMCIMGDVPAEMLAFSSREKVYDYVTHLLEIMGPTGYMVCSGCDVPFNAKLENVIAMSDARNDFYRR